MYNIGIINTGFPEEKLNSYIEEGYFKACNLDTNNLSADLEEKDAVLIFTSNVDSTVAEICQFIIEIKSKTELFVWILSDNLDEKKRIVYLQLGVDGNVDAQCTPRELQLIIDNALSRRKIHEKKSQFTRELKSPKTPLVELNEKNLSFVVEGEEVPLTKTEYSLFKLLSSNPGMAFSYEELYKKVWDKPYNNEKYRVSNIVFHIREKLEEYSLNPNHIKTVRSVGYMICE